jgi:non-canonical purine NTP pyrophosphatase (RdgB/HAM1 family)
MRKLYFATGNTRKIKEAREACELVGIKVVPIKLDIEEIQNIDGRKVGEYKAHEAFKLLQKPVVVNDTYWDIPSLNGFPGPYMKDVDSWFTTKDWLALLKGKDRTIICHENVVFADENGRLHWFGKNYKGVFRGSALGGTKHNTCLERLVSFDGGETTLASLHDEGKSAFGPEDYCWVDFPKWYAKKYLET